MDALGMDGALGLNSLLEVLLRRATLEYSWFLGETAGFYLLFYR